MNKHNWLLPGVLLTAFLAGTAVQAVPSLNSFSDGSRIRADEMNQNFTAILSWMGQQEKIAGYVARDGGTEVPYYSKLVTGTAKVDDTNDFAHGLGNVASERRVISCEVIVNYKSGTNVRAINAFNENSGSSSPKWCEVTDSRAYVAWATDTAQNSETNYYVRIDYVKTW